MRYPKPEQLRALVACNVREWRLSQGQSQAALADKAGVDRKTINRIENEHFSPSVDTLARLAKAQKKHPTQYFQGGKK